VCVMGYISALTYYLLILLLLFLVMAMLPVCVLIHAEKCMRT